MKVKDMPFDDRPREKMVSYGTKILTDSELLAIIIGNGTRKENALELAQKIISRYSMSKLSRKSVRELSTLAGIGNAKACKILACVELASRLRFRSKVQKISNPKDITRMLMEKMHNLNQENFIVLLLDSRNNLLKSETVFVGSLNETLIHPREIFYRAIKECAAGIIVSHNHPSGDSTPSLEDIDFTKKLIRVGKLVSIPILDHIIVGSKNCFSMKESGII